MSIVLNDGTGNVEFVKTGDSMNSVEHRVLARPLSWPLAISQSAVIGAPGSLGNDHVKMKVANSILETATGKIVTGSITIDVSIPRNAAFTSTHTKSLVNMAGNFLLLTDQDAAIAGGNLNRD